MSIVPRSADISALWSARSIAVVGASPRAGSLGGRTVRYLVGSGYDGEIVPVHPTAEHVHGVPAWGSVAAHGPVDLALLLVSAAATPAALDDCIAARVPVVIVGASGFADSGPAGRAVQDALSETAAAAGVRLLGPNCIGAANFHTGLFASFSPMFDGFTADRPGGLGLVSHSGGVGFGIASLAAERGLRLGKAVTTGNEADITAGEAIYTLAAQPDCTGVIAYLESLPDPVWLRRLAELDTPMAAILSGHSRAGAAAAVTRRDGDWPHDPRLLEQHGFAVADDVEELLDFAAGFAMPRPNGRRVAVITTSGGAGILAADAIARSGLELASLTSRTVDTLRDLLPPYATITNPLDVTATVISDPGLLIRALTAVSADPSCDAVLVSLCVLSGNQAAAAADVIVAAAAAGKPVLVSRTGADSLAPGLRPQLSDAGIGVYATPSRAINVLLSRSV